MVIKWAWRSCANIDLRHKLLCVLRRSVGSGPDDRADRYFGEVCRAVSDWEQPFVKSSTGKRAAGQEERCPAVLDLEGASGDPRAAPPWRRMSRI